MTEETKPGPAIEREHEVLLTLVAPEDLTLDGLPDDYVLDKIADALDDRRAKVSKIRLRSTERELDPQEAEVELGLEDVPPDQRWDKDGAF